MENELIAKLEKAPEGNRKLDAEISALIDGGFPSHHFNDHVRSSYSVGYVHEKDQGFIWGGRSAPHYTTSLDAALTLVPEGWGFWHLSQYSKDCNNEAEAHIYNDRGEEGVQADAKTPALALCIASLKARNGN